MSATAPKARFQWADPLLLDSQLSDDERQVRDAAHAYCQDRLAPRVLEAFRHEKTDLAIFREMGELGLLGSTIPEQYGGAGLNYVCYGLVAREGRGTSVYYRIADESIYALCDLVCGNIARQMERSQKSRAAFASGG